MAPKVVLYPKYNTSQKNTLYPDPNAPNLCADPTTCIHGSCSIVNEAAVCECENYLATEFVWEGESCDQMVDACMKLQPCDIGKTAQTDTGEQNCQDTDDGGFTCVCKLGYTGKTCSETEDLCSSDPCGEGNVCRAHQGTGTYRMVFRNVAKRVRNG